MTMAELENIGAGLPTNPGSYNDFLARTGMESGPAAIVAMSVEIQAHMDALVTARGLSGREELHSSPFTASKLVGQAALTEQIS